LAPKLQGGGTEEMGIHYKWGTTEETKGSPWGSICITLAPFHIC